MKSVSEKYKTGIPFAVPLNRFDQKNEMFKRSIWDEKMKPHGVRFYRDIKFREKIGYRQMDYALQNAAWNLEWGFGLGNSRSNSGLYPIELPEGCNNAIVLGIAMDYERVRTSPTTIQGAEVGLGYSRMAFVANLLSIFIRGLGYRAIPCGNDTALSVPLAMAAGLGEPGRLGFVINEKFGPRIRLCKVFTDLPLSYDSYKPFGVEAFCNTCKKCARYCPSRAIPNGKMTTEGHNISNQSGTQKWYVDAERCFAFWAKNRSDCANCIRLCPFNKPHGMIHDFSRLLVRRKSSIFNRFLLWVDDMMGYDKPVSAETFWDSQ